MCLCQIALFFWGKLLENDSPESLQPPTIPAASRVWDSDLKVGTVGCKDGTQLGGPPCTSRSTFVIQWVLQMAPPGFLLVQLPREIYKSKTSGCIMVPTTVADLEPTTDIHHLLPLLHIVDPIQSWLTPFLVGHQVTQTVILRGVLSPSHYTPLRPQVLCLSISYEIWARRYWQMWPWISWMPHIHCATSWCQSSPIFSW